MNRSSKHPPFVSALLVLIILLIRPLNAFSPRLNGPGNSIRAMRAIRQIAGELGVGLYGPNPAN